MKDWKDNSYHKKSKEDTEVKQTHEYKIPIASYKVVKGRGERKK